VRREFLARLSADELAALGELWTRFEGPDGPSC
jgi:hypothetical protein